MLWIMAVKFDGCLTSTRAFDSKSDGLAAVQKWIKDAAEDDSEPCFYERAEVVSAEFDASRDCRIRGEVDLTQFEDYTLIEKHAAIFMNESKTEMIDSDLELWLAL